MPPSHFPLSKTPYMLSCKCARDFYFWRGSHSFHPHCSLHTLFLGAPLSLIQILLNYDNLYLKYNFYSAFLKKRTFHGILSIINYQFSSVLLLQSPGKDRCTGHDKKILIDSTEYAVFEKTCEQTLLRCGDAMFFSRALNYST